MTYNEFVSQLREKARDVARLIMTENERDDLYANEQTLKDLEKALEDIKKVPARIQYKINMLDVDDPDFEKKKKDLTKDLEAAQKENKKDVENTERMISECKEVIEDNKKKIADIEACKVATSAEKLDERVKEWLKDMDPAEIPAFDATKTDYTPEE